MSCSLTPAWLGQWEGQAGDLSEMEKQGRGVLFSGLSAGSPLMSCNPTLEVSRSPGVLSTPLPWVPAFTHPHLARGRMECSRCYWRSALFFPSSLHIVGSPLARHSSKYFIRVGHLFSARILIDKCYHTPFFLFQSAPWSLLLLFKKNFPLVFSASRKNLALTLTSCDVGSE